MTAIDYDSDEYVVAYEEAERFIDATCRKLETARAEAFDNRADIESVFGGRKEGKSSDVYIRISAKDLATLTDMIEWRADW